MIFEQCFFSPANSQIGRSFFEKWTKERDFCVWFICYIFIPWYQTQNWLTSWLTHWLRYRNWCRNIVYWITHLSVFLGLIYLPIPGYVDEAAFKSYEALHGLSSCQSTRCHPASPPGVQLDGDHGPPLPRELILV